ncbi:MAG: Ppx/GppA family phosphatase [Deltaproteobacteria bacterium]|jgi:exopolyphosphatase/guanosine-5'-triphosphate,3'-diphosphate pyrophosphatase|nr:Ppx/GppA family phosphatase [Deltaproteobacteria bacterium]
MKELETKSRRGALIDLGTNSVRLIIVELADDGGLTILSQKKSPVALGQGSFDDDQLTVAAMDRALAALENMATTIACHQVDYVRAVATSSMREVSNRDEFLALVYGRLKLDLKVISGLEEARLIWMGVTSNLRLGSFPSLIMDIGGGSVELIVDQVGQEPLLDSLPLGSARLSGRFGLLDSSQPIDPDVYEKLKQYVRTHTSRFLTAAKGRQLTCCWGCSGTLENLARVWHKRTGNDQTKVQPVPARNLTDLGLWLGSMNLEIRRQTPGLDHDKASMIVAGCAVVDTVLEELAISEFEAVPFGLKHGLIQEFAAAYGAIPSGGRSPRLDSVLRLGKRCLFDEQHAEQVSAAAVKIYDAFARHGLVYADKSERELIGYAGLLHDVGKFLSYEGHQAHGWYLVRNASMLGFDDYELELIAYLVLFHRGPKRLKKDILPSFLTAIELTGQGRRTHWPKLALFLWLAELFEGRRQGALESFELTLSGSKVYFLLSTRAGSSLEAELELLGKTSKYIENIFGLNYSGYEIIATK